MSTRSQYPALEDMMRGYFHQDFIDEYGSPEGAVRQFLRDASREERENTAREWREFLRTVQDLPLPKIQHHLETTLRSHWHISGPHDLDKITAAFAETP